MVNFLNLDLLKNQNPFWSQTDKLISALENNVVQPFYVYPQNIDKKEQTTYMVLYIYDRVGDIGFSPIESKIVTKSIIDDIRDNISDIVKINVDSKWKEGLKNYRKDLLEALKKKLESFDFDGLFGDSDFSWLSDSLKDIGKTAKSWANALGEGVSDVVDTIGTWIGSIAKSVGLPSMMDYLPDGLIPKIDITIDKNKIKELIEKKKSELLPKYSKMEKAEEDKYGVHLIGSICLGLPSNAHNVNLQTNISSKELFQSQNLKDVVDRAYQSYLEEGQNGGNLLDRLSEAAYGGVTEAVELVKRYGKEMLYDMIGDGGKAIYQSEYNRIRDPMIYFMYSLPSARTYRFTYVFAPKNHEELMTITNIIKMLKYCAAPGIGGNTSEEDPAKYSSGKNSAYFTLPSKFRIKFYTNSVENIWYGKTKLLGLTSIDVEIPDKSSFIIDDYSFSAGNAPRIIGLDLSFTELTLVDKDDINEGY